MSAKIIDKDLGLDKIYKNLKGFSNVEITVGLHSDTGTNNGVRVVDYATWNHFGTKKIPSRPFLSISYDNNDGWGADINNAIGKVVSNKTDKSSVLSALAQKVKKDVKGVIEKGVPPPNAPSTIRRKKSSKTLIDTGVMLSKVDYKIKGSS